MPDAKRPVVCPTCGKRLTAPESYAGRMLKCPQCANTFPCSFASGVAPVASASTHVPSAFRMVEVAGEKKRGAAVEMARLGLGILGALVGSALGAILWGAASVAIGYVVGLVGILIVGLPTGFGMRLGYGRPDVTAGLLAALLSVVGFVGCWATLVHGRAMGMPIWSALMTMSVAFTAASGRSLSGD